MAGHITYAKYETNSSLSNEHVQMVTLILAYSHHLLFGALIKQVCRVGGMNMAHLYFHLYINALASAPATPPALNNNPF